MSFVARAAACNNISDFSIDRFIVSPSRHGGFVFVFSKAVAAAASRRPPRSAARSTASARAAAADVAERRRGRRRSRRGRGRQVGLRPAVASSAWPGDAARRRRRRRRRAEEAARTRSAATWSRWPCGAALRRRVVVVGREIVDEAADDLRRRWRRVGEAVACSPAAA